MEITPTKFYFIVKYSHTAICNHICKKKKSHCQPKLTCTLTKPAILNLNVLPGMWAAGPREMIHQSGSSPFHEAEGC